MTTAWQDIFAAAREQQATTLYAIAFTPRSGSSWLGDVLMRSGILGNPDEWFNNRLCRQAIVDNGLTNLEQYYYHLKARHQSGGTFGVQLAWPHMRDLGEMNSLGLLHDIENWFYLRRRDYVAQGVSLYRAIHSGVWHSSDKEKGSAETPYDGDRIASMILRILLHEQGFRRYFRNRGVDPVCLWYEDTIGSEPTELVKLFADTLSLPSAALPEADGDALRSDRVQLANDASRVLAARFREEHAELTAFWDQNRGVESLKTFITKYPRYSLRSQ